VLGAAQAPRFAVVDAVEVLNPRDGAKAGVREIDQLQAIRERRAHWNQVRREKRIPEVQPAATARVLELAPPPPPRLPPPGPPPRPPAGGPAGQPQRRSG
jgi:hypothetical protein